VIKGVFFDWFNTLAHYQTPREELYRQAFRGAGLDIPLAAIYQGLQAGDRHYFSKKMLAIKPGNTLDEISNYYHLYPQFILTAAKAELPEDEQISIVKKVLGSFSNTFVLFEEVLPVLNEIKRQGKLIGIITNANHDVIKIIQGLIGQDLVDSIVTSEEAGAEKPHPLIFTIAINKLSLAAAESVYVGDQYQSDILGANGIGMKAILIDRFDAASNGQGCIKVKDLKEIIHYIT
jgi:putative hydrolase of the HAD superfamily